jgi:carbamoylphosphate synthase large subunit
MSSQTVLVTCAASLVVPSSLAAIRQQAADSYRFIGVDASAEPLALDYLDGFYQIPFATEPDYVSTLLDIIAQTQANLLLVLSDNEALVLAEPTVRRRIEAMGCQLLLPDYEVIRCCVDKGLFLQFLEQSADTAETFRLVDNAKDLAECASAFHYPDKSFIVKPRSGCGSRGVMLIDAKASEVELLLSRHYKNYKLEFVCQALQHSTALNLLAMPYYQGNDYNIDVLCQQGTVVYSMVQRRVSPKMGAIMTAEIVQEADINLLVQNLVARLNVTGLINIEIARCMADGQPRVYEINPRPSAAFAFICYQQTDVFTDLVQVMQGKTVAEKHFLPMLIKRVWSQLYRYE